MNGRQWFVTSTGTDIGKTFVTALIARYLRRCGYAVAVAKPLMSGVEEMGENDAASLLHAIGQPVIEETVRAISPWIFREALSPHRAAERASEVIDINAVLEWCHAWLASHSTQHCLMEGAGGVAVPLNYHDTTLTWLRALHLPLIMVVGDYLGTISHSLTALQCVHHAGLHVEAIIVNQSVNSTDHVGVCATLRAFSPYPDIPILSLMRYTMQEIALWEDDSNWEKSRLWQEQQDFFMTIHHLL